MTRDDSQSCLAFPEEQWHCWHFSLLSYALLGTIQYELSTTLKLSPRPSSTPIQLQVYIILELLHSHFIKLHPRLDSKRNRRRRRLETKPVATRGNNYQTLPIVYSHRASNDIRATELLLNTIIMLPHIVYKLYVPVLFIYTKKTQTLTTRTTGADCPDEREIL